MSLFKHIFISLILLYGISIKAAEIIGIEVKEIDNMDVMIFYHPNHFKIDVSYSGGKIKVKSDHLIKFRKLTPVSIEHIVKDLKNVNGKTFSAKTKEKYSSFEIVRGEKLTAIKFRTQNKPVKLTDQIKPSNKIKHENPEITADKQAIFENTKSGVDIKKRKDLIEIQFNFSSVVGASAFERSGKVWIGFNKKQLFDFPHRGDVTPPTFIDHEEATILCFDIPKGLHSEFVSKGESWILRFKKDPIGLTTKYKAERLIGHYGVHVSGEDFQKVISFKDPEVGDIISLVATTKQLSGINETLFFNDFILHHSLLGVAIEWNVEDFRIKITPTGVKLSSLDNPVNLAIENEIQKDSNTDFSETYLPVDFKPNPSFDFLTRRSIMLLNVASSSHAESKEKTLDLAKFYFAEHLLTETLGALNLIEFDKDFAAKHPEAIFLKAVTLSMIGRYKEAKEVFNFLNLVSSPNALIAESNLWHKYNNYKLGQRTDSIGITDYLGKFFDKYPDYLYWKLVGAEFEVTILNNDLSIVENLLRKIRAPVTMHDINLLTYSKASFYRKNKRYNLATNYYDAIKIKGLDAEYYVRGEFDRINMLMQIKQIETHEALLNLQSLKFLWRGDDIEYQVLLKTAQLEEQTKDYLKSLRTYKYILDVFPNDKGAIDLSNHMSDIFNNFIFSKSGYYTQMSDFELVALYYEFKELTPIGESGDKIVLEVAKRLINLDLFNQAEKILDHQVKYRLGEKDKIISGEHLATVYILDKKPQLAVDVLNDTDVINVGFLEHLARQKLKSKAYIDLGDYNSALTILKNDDSLEAKIIKEEAYFKLGDWDNFALLAESSLFPILVAEKIIPENQEKETLRLAICYAMLGKQEELGYLHAHLKTKNKTLEQAIAALRKSNEKIDIQKLENNFKVDEFDKYFKSIVDKLFNFA